MSEAQDTARKMASEVRQLVVKLNTQLELCKAQRLTAHLELVGGRLQFGSEGITLKHDEETIWAPEGESEDG